MGYEGSTIGRWSRGCLPSRPGHVRIAHVVALLMAVGASIQAQERPPAPPVTQIGVAAGDPRAEFAAITDLAAAADGSVFILDDMNFQLRWFGADGKYRASVGRKGGGPAEFEAPTALTTTDDGRVHVVDNRNQRIGVFRTTVAGGKAGSTYELTYERGDRLPFQVHDICAIGTRRFVLGIGQPKLIHELGPNGRVVRSFGDPLPLDAEVRRGFSPAGLHLLTEMYNSGHLACDARSGRVYLLHSQRALVRAFSASGQPLWDATLTDALKGSVTPARGGASIVTAPDKETGAFRGPADIAVGADGTIAVSVGEFRVQDDGGTGERYEVRRLRAADGVQVARTVARGRVSAIQGGRRYASVQSPFPSVFLY